MESMESTKINILLFAGVVCLALASSNDCSTKMMECTGKVTEIQNKLGGMGQGGGIPSKEMISTMCKSLTDVESCFEDAAKTCGDSVKAMMNQILVALATVKSMCEPDNPCTQLKLLECSRSMAGVGQGEMNYKEMCPTIPESMNCLQTGRDACKDEEMKAQFDQGLTMVRNMDNSCKQQLGDNYAVGKQQLEDNYEFEYQNEEPQKQDGDGTSKGGSGSGDKTGIKSGSGNDGSNGSGKIVGMTGLLIITSLFAKLAQ